MLIMISIAKIVPCRQETSPIYIYKVIWMFEINIVSLPQKFNKRNMYE